MTANKKIIVIKDAVLGTFSNADAVPLRILMEDSLKNRDSVVLSFDGVHTLTSSFLNSSIGEIVDSFGFDTLKGRVSLTNYTPSVASVITNYINDLKGASA